MDLIIKINMDNSAFSEEDGNNPYTEVKRIVNKAVESIAFDDENEVLLMDINGNTVGQAKITL